MTFERLIPPENSLRTGLLFAIAAHVAIPHTTFAQVHPGEVSPVIPYLSPMISTAETVMPVLPPDIPGTGFANVPEPGFRPVFAMTDVSRPVHAHKCTCGHKSLVKKILRKKCKMHPDMPPAFVPNPFQEQPQGVQMFELMNTQVRNNDAARQVLNHYDFVDDLAELNYAGKRKLMRIARGSQTNFAPIVIEATPRQPGLDQSRRMRLVEEIASLGYPIPPERVIVGQSHQQGLRGPDAILMYQGTLGPLGQGGGSGGLGPNAVGGMNATGLLPTGGGTGGGSSNASGY